MEQTHLSVLDPLKSMTFKFQKGQKVAEFDQASHWLLH